MKNASDRKRKLRVRKREVAGNPERMKCFVKMNGVRVKSTGQKNGNGNQIHDQRAQSCPPASRGPDSFNGNIEEMVVDDVPIVKSRASRVDYQTSQTTWKNRMEAQDTRYNLCSKCDKTIHTKQLTHQRKCEVNNCLHSLQSTEFLTNEGNLETLSIIKFHCQCLFPTDARIALGLADDFDAALEEDDLIMGDCETDEDDCCDWLNGEDCNFTTEA
ncbi:uncharacterized protein LOC116930092 [Daphnia magna]|uniref:uncharacterized protein LOC116930092 n=1 Tax=Daphnia magna TaxID=35525 RepID=UPI001E1BD2F1|nr:uncharacterized protein LOC116930092 [Daphnia magna]